MVWKDSVPAPQRNAASTAGSFEEESNALQSICRSLPIVPQGSVKVKWGCYGKPIQVNKTLYHSYLVQTTSQTLGL